MSRYGTWMSLRVLRIRSGYSLRGLARAAGLSASYMVELEQGKYRASPATVARLAGVLKVPVPMLERHDQES